MRYLFLLLTIAGCESFTAPRDARRYIPPSVFRELWARTEACAGRTGQFERVRWFVTDSPIIAPDGSEKAGAWHAPHDIYIRAVYVEYPADTNRVVRHEILHDLSGRADHPPVFDTCGVR